MRSFIYECKIWHERRYPRFHAFTARHFMFYLCLNDLNSNRMPFRLLSFNVPNIFSFFEKDFLAPRDKAPRSSLVDRVKSTAVGLGVRETIERIDLLTNLRIFNYVFNPVSFYFCFTRDERVLCCICEVGNTFGERKVFLVTPDSTGLLKGRQKKFFYVSPFTKLDQEFYFNISVPAEQVDLKIDTMDGDIPIVKASLKGRRTELNDAKLFNLLLTHSWATAKVIALIHIHALILWLKKVPFHRKEEAADMQLDILEPL